MKISRGWYWLGGVAGGLYVLGRAVISRQQQQAFAQANASSDPVLVEQVMIGLRAGGQTAMADALNVHLQALKAKKS